MGVSQKADIEASLQQEQKMILEGKLKEDNPLDLSETFRKLCEACRRGDLKLCQEMLTEGANINARDPFDYTPLILASLCGHYEAVQLLLESGALCERDTFQGERCLYNALNDRIRNLLLSYDYSKTADPLQPFAAHITSLLTRENPKTSDILVTAADDTFRLHKFILSARSPYFSHKLATAPDTTTWKLAVSIPAQAFDIAIRYLYFGEIPNDVGGGPGTGATEDEILEGIDKITKQLEIRNLWDGILESGDRRLARQRRTDEVDRGRSQLESWYRDHSLRHKLMVDRSRAHEVRWDRDNGIFADVLLQANDHEDEEEETDDMDQRDNQASENGIPIGPLGLAASRSPSPNRSRSKTTLFPVHRAMLLRSEYFAVMFSSGFREAQNTEYLQIIPIDCSSEVLEVVLTFLYSERTDFPLELAIDVLFAADLLLIDKLKMKAAVVISTLGNGPMSQIPSRLDTEASTSGDNSGSQYERQKELSQDELDIYDVIRAGWLTRVPRLEEFGARYLAYRLEYYIDEAEFADLVKESAGRIQSRQETDTIELLDDIRYYLSERFRLRFEDVGIEEMLEDESLQPLETSPPQPSMATQSAHELGDQNGIAADHQRSQVPSESSARSKVHAALSLAERNITSILNASTLEGSWNTEHDALVHTGRDSAQEKPADPSLTLDDPATTTTTTMIRTLDGEIVSDEMEEEARNYSVLLAKIDGLLDRLKLDA